MSFFILINKFKFKPLTISRLEGADTNKNHSESKHAQRVHASLIQQTVHMFMTCRNNGERIVTYFFVHTTPYNIRHVAVK